MIKRTYFISAQCYKNDGSADYSHFYAISHHKSWKPKHSKVFEDMVNRAKDIFLSKGLDVKNYQLIAFNRV